MGYYKITQLKMSLEHEETDLLKELNSLYGFGKDVTFDIKKKSVDARKKNGILIVYNLNVYTPESRDKRLLNVPYILEVPVYSQPVLEKTMQERPIIVGAGPAGLFAALILAEAGAKPIIIERGEDVLQRMKTVEHYFESGELNTTSNIQFGEGGAGTFSDGKINTGVKDRFNRIDKIVKTFIEAGAPEEIGYVSKPHIGTDYLIEVVKNIRQKIIALGGEVMFNKTVSELLIQNNVIEGVVLEDGSKMMSKHVVLAIGHSARDTFEMLVDKKVPMEQKGFAIGLRIEHPQSMISMSQYGPNWQHRHLPVADYKLTYRTKKGRGVYSFCTCPGGFVVNSASEEGGVVCNGMSNFARDEVNANSAILVNVHPEDFGSDNLLAGVDFQRKWEVKAFEIAGANYHLPVQTLGGFVKNQRNTQEKDVHPNIKGAYTFANLNDTLPEFVSTSIKESLIVFGRRIKGFDRKDAILTGVETRSSSPVRIIRDVAYMSEVQGLYPCGEGAGYAGGIMSAALDGMKVAEAVVIKVNKE